MGVPPGSLAFLRCGGAGGTYGAERRGGGEEEGVCKLKNSGLPFLGVGARKSFVDDMEQVRIEYGHVYHEAGWGGLV